MAYCCAEFEKYAAKGTKADGDKVIDPEEGFWIGRYYRKPPHDNPIRMTWLYYEFSDHRRDVLELNFCPWCGCDLKSNPKAPWKRI